ncbi:MAG TPA: plasmid stabilization protein [Actinocrinis sp.]
MPSEASPKRERQYQHVKQSVKKRGAGEKRAEEIASRTVNKQRARSGESRTASPESVNDMSSGKRASQRRGTGGGGQTFDQLYAEARRRNIEGRSSMNKEQLQKALSR